MSVSVKDDPRTSGRPNKLPWPPIILLGTIAVAWLVTTVMPLHLAGGKIVRTAGFGTIGLGLALDAWAMLTMRRWRANILPHCAATALVTSGPFALSRNPIYLGNVVLTVGLAMAIGNAWLLLGAVVEVVLIRELAIRREERHLAALFGSEFEDYRSTTARWIGFHSRGR